MLKLLLILVGFQVIEGQLDQHEIVPDVLDINPPSVLEVTYNDNDKVQEGNELTPTLVKNQPTVKWEADPNDYYLLIMTDPDAPSRSSPIYREFLHWLVGNIPGSDISKGKTLAEYVGSGPPADSGLHRYIFLLYKQPGKINFDNHNKSTSNSRGGRKSFSTRNFIKEYSIDQLLAGNLFQAQWDSYVPILHKQLSGN